ncbi:tetratricopeptide repeat protein [Solwaraspora sp. WMMD792]|uniref:tetratricopeptide repeat protein n=1 Tax=Solwaraspora sp. WMMD792 TaxID=3016099 RepID=UPI0024167651|nr:tetratricopeptide repeat protein [Solwaraspora sp. WMMD792]MDG4773611.1 tetratricopeptide repeat protein [Solwaraspora sp. WMMD792]
MSSTPAVAVQPVVNWPRTAQAGKRYLVTIDAETSEPIEWPYDREEFIIGCVLEGGDAFTIEALGSTSLVLHRFGGTYGPVRFVAQAERNPNADGSDMLRLTLLTEGGLPLPLIPLPVLPEGTNGIDTSTASLRWSAPAQSTPTPTIRTREMDATVRQVAKRTALLIGVNSHGLHGPENDLPTMAPALADYGFETTMLSGADATRARILTAYERLIEEAGPDDAVFIFYSGQGGATTIRRPPGSGRTDGLSHLHVPFITPANYDNVGSFEGITTIEIARLLTRLAAKTPNVVAAYDCSNGAHAPHLVPATYRADLQGLTPVPDAVERHVIALGAAVLEPVDPNVVQLHGCSPGEHGYEAPDGNGSMTGVFSLALARALKEAVGLQLSWSALVDHVRRLIRARGTDQWPTITGPAQRLLFSAAEAEQETSLPVIVEDSSQLRILGAPLLGVRTGDEFALMPPGATGPDAVNMIGEAIVEHVAATDAWARLRLRESVTAIPIDARAHRVKAAAPLLPVQLPPSGSDHDELIAAVTASPLLRPAYMEAFEYEVCVDEGGTATINDRLGPLTDPIPATAWRTVLTQLERLARAAALRSFAEDSRSTLEDLLYLKWGTVEDGRLISHQLSGTYLHVGQSIYLQLFNMSAKTLFVSVVDIGVAATITLINKRAPAGIRLAPGQEYVLGQSENGDLEGLRLIWPDHLSPSHARTETILILTTSRPQDVAVLEQQGVRSVSGDARSTLSQRLTQLVLGGSRDAARTRESASLYSVRSIDFLLDPRPAAKTHRRSKNSLHSARHVDSQGTVRQRIGHGRPYTEGRAAASTAFTESVEYYRQLAAKNPGIYLSDLAMSLNNWSNRLAGVGRWEEGLAAIEEAITIYRRLADANPTAYLPDLAGSLNNWSVDLGEVGRREEGLAAIEEAITIYRRLADANPTAYLPDLAGSLNNWSVDLGEVGRREEGLAAIEEAITIYRRLADANPTAYLPDLAMSLNNWSNRLAGVGRREEGLAAIEEAITIRRRLADANPTAYLPDLAMSLNNWSVRLAGVGRREEGLAAIEEAITIRRRLADANPTAYLPDLAGSLNNWSVDLGEVGRREEGLAAIEEAITIYRRLADANPTAYLPDLAMSLNNWSNRLAGVGRREEGLAAIEEAITIYRRLADANPTAYLPDLAGSLNNWSVDLGEVGRREEGLAAIEEAITIRRRLADANPTAYLPDLAGSLNNWSVDLGEVGRREEGLAAIEEAITIYRRLADANPTAYLPDLAMSLNNRSHVLSALGRDSEAVADSEMAERLIRQPPLGL